MTIAKDLEKITWENQRSKLMDIAQSHIFVIKKEFQDMSK
jgi:hypothetical protein